MLDRMIFSLSTPLKSFKLVVLVVFHLHTYSSNPTAVSGYEDDTEEGKEGVGEGRLVEPPCTQCSDGEWTDDGNDCCDELYIVSICILTCVGSLHRECYLIIYCHLK